MHVAELRRRLGAILAAEDRAPADWPEIERLKDELYRQLQSQPDSECPDAGDPLSRRRGYARGSGDELAGYEREEVRRFVETGEYANHRAPGSTRPLILTLIGGVLLWLVL